MDETRNLDVVARDELPGPRAAFDTQIASDLARQLRALIAEIAAGRSPPLQRALVEAGLWTVGGFVAWVVVYFVA